MVAFGFMSQNFGGDIYLPFYECSFSRHIHEVVRTLKPYHKCKVIFLNFLHSQAAGTQKVWTDGSSLIFINELNFTHNLIIATTDAGR